MGGVTLGGERGAKRQKRFLEKLGGWEKNSEKVFRRGEKTKRKGGEEPTGTKNSKVT